MRDDEPPKATGTQSATDPNCGIFHKGEHAKDKHAMRYTQYRSKPMVKMELLTTFAAMDLKISAPASLSYALSIQKRQLTFR